MFLHAQRRHPLAYTNSIELIGNVHYNAVASGEEAMNFRPYWDSMTLSHVGSYFENGPVTTGLSWANISTSVSSNCSPSNWDCVANSAWFVSGNRQATLRPNDGLPETDIYTSWDGTREALRLLNVPGPEWTQPPFLTAEEYRDIVTDEENNPTKAAGACFPGNCDATDQRLHDDFDNKTGQLPDFFSDVPGGYPTYENAVRQAGYDSDWDGMPDTYEDANGLDKNNPNDGALVANGEAYYTNLELYLNGLVDEDSPAPPDPDTTPPQPPEGIIVSSLIALLGIGLGVLLFIGGRNHAFKPSH